MARTYQVTSVVRFANRIVQMLLRLGIGSKGTYLLTVRGRKTGKLHSNPVTLIEEGGQRWLVAPYGEVNWVHNARSAGQVILTRGRQSETVDVVELGPAESAPVLKRYVNGVPITRPYFDAGPDSPLEAFKAEAARHPVFVIQAKSS
jgi:deazaflavin-dependent oxidoreductase (nitroreductase family)